MLEAVNTVLAATVVALAAWVFNTNSKVEVTLQQVADLKESQEGIEDSLGRLMQVQFDNVNDRLERIERCLNGSLKPH